MSARGGGAFAQVLREVGSGLTLPLPARVHILRELAYDLEALSDRLVAEGMSMDEARQRASEALVPDAKSLHALERLHQPLYTRITAHITPDRLKLGERWALVGTATVVLTGGLALLRVNLLDQPVFWPVLALGVVLVAAVLAKAFEFWIKRDHAVPERGLNTILGLAGGTVLTGIVGALLDLYRLAATLTASPELAATMAPAWLVRDATLLAVSLVIALSGAVSWFTLRQWLAFAQRAQREVLGIDDTTGNLRRKNDG